jgi:transposase
VKSLRATRLFGKGGRRWLAKAPLPKTERDLHERHLDELDWLAGRLETLERDLIHKSLDDPWMRKLMTVAGISSVIAMAVIAPIGDIGRFATPEKLASYFGLTPRVRQSGDRRAIHARITKQGNATARTMLVEAAWSAASVPGPLRAFILRIKDRKGANVAAVATARKIATLIWHLLTKDAPYQWAGHRPGTANGRRARPAFVAMKMRKLELRAGAPKAHGKAGPGRDYWIKELRHREMELVANTENAYARMVEAWRENHQNRNLTEKRAVRQHPCPILERRGRDRLGSLAQRITDGLGQWRLAGYFGQLRMQPIIPACKIIDR